jgi:hypothetical protein
MENANSSEATDSDDAVSNITAEEPVEEEVMTYVIDFRKLNEQGEAAVALLTKQQADEEMKSVMDSGSTHVITKLKSDIDHFLQGVVKLTGIGTENEEVEARWVRLKRNILNCENGIF